MERMFVLFRYGLMTGDGERGVDFVAQCDTKNGTFCKDELLFTLVPFHTFHI